MSGKQSKLPRLSFLGPSVAATIGGYAAILWSNKQASLSLLGTVLLVCGQYAFLLIFQARQKTAQTLGTRNLMSVGQVILMALALAILALLAFVAPTSIWHSGHNLKLLTYLPLALVGVASAFVVVELNRSRRFPRPS